jgi:hypothetical protein
VIFLNTYWNTQNQMYEFRFSFMGAGALALPKPKLYSAFHTRSIEQSKGFVLLCMVGGR